MALDFLDRGVPQGPFGSMVRTRFGIDNSDPDALFSSEGLGALTHVLSEYRKAGSTFGGAPTFRLTDFRAGDDDKAWEPPSDDSRLSLRRVTGERNATAVSMIKQVHGENVVGLIAPLSDTSGKHDARWVALGDKQAAWAMRRQRPQIEALLDAGVRVIWGEAFRYREEAMAVARLIRGSAAQALVLNFEANDKGMPDPGNDGSYTFMNMEADLQREVGPDKKVLVGANCTGINNIRRIWRRGDRVKVAYPNSLNFGDHEKLEFATLVETHHRSPEQNARIARMEADHATSLPEYVAFVREAVREHGVLIVGGCCGTTPEHAWVARKALDEVQTM